MKFRPCIDLHNGKVKQIVGSSLSDDPAVKLKTNFETEESSAKYVLMYKRDGLIGGHIIMLGPGNKHAAIEALNAYPNGMQIGGGITPSNAKQYLDNGASHIIVTSYVFKDGVIYWDRINELIALVGKKHLVLDLSCKKKEGEYFIVTDRWQKFTKATINADTLQSLGEVCDEFLVHAADVEGMQQGIDEELIELLSLHSTVPVTYAGGVRSIEDLERIKQIGKGNIDATVGSALDIFGGKLSYAQVVNWDMQQRKETNEK